MLFDLQQQQLLASLAGLTAPAQQQTTSSITGLTPGELANLVLTSSVRTGTGVHLNFV